MDINSLIANYNSIDELKIFCQAQFKQVQSLTKKNKELQDKIDKLTKEAKQLTKVGSSIPATYDGLKVLDDAKTISQIQLNLLKEASFDRELNTDEAKRVELYNRILKEETAKEKPLKADVEVVASSDLLKLVE